MFNHWLISDIEEAARKSDRIVISDPKQFLTFMVKELKDYAIITLNSPEEEMNARLQAMTLSPTHPLPFYGPGVPLYWVI